MSGKHPRRRKRKKKRTLLAPVSGQSVDTIPPVKVQAVDQIRARFQLLKAKGSHGQATGI